MMQQNRALWTYLGDVNSVNGTKLGKTYQEGGLARVTRYPLSPRHVLFLALGP